MPRLAQAFQSLIRPLLSKSEAELDSWRDALREALGPNGRLIVDLVPELKLIIGEQPPVPELPPQDAQRRFQLVFRRFIGVFARPEHPLALFLDDLQWLDAATLDLLEDLLTQPDVQHLLLIGAYRDNEVNATHPLMRKLDAIRQAGASSAGDRPCAARPSTIWASCWRIPFTANRSAPPRWRNWCTRRRRAIRFSPFSSFLRWPKRGYSPSIMAQARWSWDLNRIHAKGYTDNVVDLMVGKLNRLPVETQKALTAACLHGQQRRVRHAGDGSRGLGRGHARRPLGSGPVGTRSFRSEGSYRFLHDRVQEAAYSLIPEELRAEAHLRIGRLLAAHTPPEKREEAIFEIVNQLNRGAALITSRDEREQLAELNLIAGKRAKSVDRLRLGAHVSRRRRGAAGGRLLGAPARAHLRAGVAPGRMRVPDR